MTAQEFKDLNYYQLAVTLINRKFIIFREGEFYQVFMRESVAWRLQRWPRLKDFQFWNYEMAEMSRMDVPFDSPVARTIENKYQNLILNDT